VPQSLLFLTPIYGETATKPSRGDLTMEASISPRESALGIGRMTF